MHFYDGTFIKFHYQILQCLGRTQVILDGNSEAFIFHES